MSKSNAQVLDEYKKICPIPHARKSLDILQAAQNIQTVIFGRSISDGNTTYYEVKTIIEIAELIQQQEINDKKIEVNNKKIALMDAKLMKG